VYLTIAKVVFQSASEQYVTERRASKSQLRIAVVRENSLRKAAVLEVAKHAFSLGLGCLGVVASDLPGPSGNVEYFLWLKENAPALLEVDLDNAIALGPSKGI
jgi:hypothetical protein